MNMVETFDLKALYSAIDDERSRRGLTWSGVAKEIKERFVRVSHGNGRHTSHVGRRGSTHLRSDSAERMACPLVAVGCADDGLDDQPTVDA